MSHGARGRSVARGRGWRDFVFGCADYQLIAIITRAEPPQIWRVGAGVF